MKLLLTLLALVLCSCAETFVGEEIARPNNENLPDLTATFADEEATRTYIEEGKYLRWNEDDRLTIFFGNTLNRQYKFNGKTGDNSGTFSLLPDGMLGTGNAIDCIYALYPHNEGAKISDEGVISLTLPAVQDYAENSFGHGANTMLAVTENLEDTFLSFKNVCGYLKLKLYDPDGGGLKSLSVKGNNGEKIAGTATATIKFGEAPIVAITDEATDTITLDCGEGISLGTTAETATEFWIVLPETTFTNGITITATDVDGGTFEKSTSNEVIIERNTIQPMAAVEVSNSTIDFIGSPENNEIWYINGSTDAPTKPYNESAFNATILSNTYDAQKKCWVISFDGILKTIGYQAFRFHWKYPTLLNIKLPESVTSIGERAFISTGLQNIVIPNGVKEIGPYALSHCTDMETILIGSGVNSMGDFAFAETTGKIILNCNIPSPLHDQGQYATAFSSNSFSEIIIGDTVASIGEYAFDSSYYSSNGASITIGKNVSEIGNLAFRGCNGKLIVKNNLPDHPIYYPLIGGIQFTEIVIDTGVSNIGTAAFMNGYTIKSLLLEKDIKIIGDYAFYNCSGLSTIYCKALTPPTLSNYTFYNLSTNCIIYVPSESVDLYKSASGWSDYADIIVAYDFEKGEVVPDVLKPANNEIWYTSSDGNVVTPYKTNVFGATIISNEYNNGMGIITFDGDVTTIGDSAFRNCTRLTSVNIPDSVTSIGSDAFTGCNLTSLTIPDSVTEIGDFGWLYYDESGNNNIICVYFRPTTPPDGWITRDTCIGIVNLIDAFYQITIYVPRDSYDIYLEQAKAEENWRDYLDEIVKPYDFSNF